MQNELLEQFAVAMHRDRRTANYSRPSYSDDGGSHGAVPGYINIDNHKSRNITHP
jgi:hypothetical protein